MKRWIAAALSLILLAGSLCACGNRTEKENDGRQPGEPSAGESGNGRAVSIPEELSEIPDAYFSPVENPGTLVDLNYDTLNPFPMRRSRSRSKSTPSSICRAATTRIASTIFFT